MANPSFINQMQQAILAGQPMQAGLGNGPSPSFTGGPPGVYGQPTRPSPTRTDPYNGAIFPVGQTNTGRIDQFLIDQRNAGQSPNGDGSPGFVNLNLPLTRPGYEALGLGFDQYRFNDPSYWEPRQPPPVDYGAVNRPVGQQAEFAQRMQAHRMEQNPEAVRIAAGFNGQQPQGQPGNLLPKRDQFGNVTWVPNQNQDKTANQGRVGNGTAQGAYGAQNGRPTTQRPRPTAQQMAYDQQAKSPPGSGTAIADRGRATPGNVMTANEYNQQQWNAGGQAAGGEPPEATAIRNLPWNQGTGVQNGLQFQGGGVGDFGMPEPFSPGQQAQIGAAQGNINARFDQIAQQFNRPQGEGEAGMYQPLVPQQGNRPVFGQPNPTGGRVVGIGGAGGVRPGVLPGAGGVQGQGGGMTPPGATPPPSPFAGGGFGGYGGGTVGGIGGTGGGPRPILGQPNPAGGQNINAGYGNDAIRRPGAGTPQTFQAGGGAGAQITAMQTPRQPQLGADGHQLPQLQQQRRPAPGPTRVPVQEEPWPTNRLPQQPQQPTGYVPQQPGGYMPPQAQPPQMPQLQQQQYPPMPQGGGMQQGGGMPDWGQMFGVPRTGYQTQTTTQRMPTQTYMNVQRQQYQY